MDKRLIISKIEPVIKIEKTEGKNSHWVTTGTVSFVVSRGDDHELGVLEVPFHDADGRADAYGQAIKTMESIVSRLTECIEAVRDRVEEHERMAA